MIARALHIANSHPEWIGKKEFYAVKERILKRWGTPDGYDIQHIPGKICYGCDGGGLYYHWSGDADTCYRCCGYGWFKHPVWVTLKRYRFGRYSFHVPENRSYEKPEPDVTRITGYINHPSYSYAQVHRAAFLIFMLFDRKSAWRVFREWLRTRKYIRWWQSRCMECKGHRWSRPTWRCAKCDLLYRQGKIHQDIPF